MNPDAWLLAACLTACAVAALALLLLADRRSFLSRLVDGQAAGTAEGNDR